MTEIIQAILAYWPYGLIAIVLVTVVVYCRKFLKSTILGLASRWVSKRENATFKSWQTIGLSIATCLSIALFVTIVTQSYLWGLLSAFATFGWLFVPSLDGSNDIWPNPNNPKKKAELEKLRKEGSRVPVGMVGVYLVLGDRMGSRGTKEVDGQKIPTASGPTAGEGDQATIPYAMHLWIVDMRMQISRVEKLRVFAKDGVAVEIDSEVYWRINNPHQSLNFAEGEIENAIDEAAEATHRDVAKLYTSDELTKSAEHRKTIREEIIKSLDRREKKFGCVDIMDAFVGEIAPTQKIQESMELKKQNELYLEARDILKNAGIPEDEIKETTQLHLGIAKPKDISESKVDVGATLGGTVTKIAAAIIEATSNKNK